MNYLQQNFIYLSQIIGLPVVVSGDGARVGYVSDLVAGLREMYPKITAVKIRKKMSAEHFYVLWKDVVKVAENKALVITSMPEANVALGENEICLRETFWDKQIVDISGSKVVRVNDLHLLREDPNFWVVHMDIGFKGLVRRLGWAPFVEYISKWLFAYELKERFISWKYVQPVTMARAGESLSLKVPHSKMAELHPAELADILIDIGTDERIAILKALGNTMAASALKELPLKLRIQTAELLKHDQLASIINEMPPDEAVDILNKLPRKKVSYILNALQPDKVAQLKNLLSYSEKVAGSLMNTEYVSVRSSVTVNQVWEKIRAELKKKESIYYVYVLDDNDTLIGVLTLRQLLTAQHDKMVSEVMRKRVAKVRVDDDVKDVAQHFLKYDFTVLPVVDKHNKIQGTITIKDAFESVYPRIREEAEQELA
ncbi:MAG TPA: hypothetical protein DEE98_04360 [Elusimicrobia bacterium]|nr:MAG: hypothetical protein A2278_08890 [Elusimicrobia bacterium RIFOXYA12_FULL_49_49]OGS08636.1 MAG: hypothetical protein A2204_00995 [Elusimicrobia bacterium RIFOXYA1_FULL_47_7]OGS10732.1 MAG: hypothetical protein A2386_02965 [Elusimicrobia bacterium RIFOXYB1_FULL_48_9]OGS14758.1 MAG: hypothetical protein A2251_09705 [Elusimicrobia bacterium RIFOXYA2_FULL_47_53]OGS25591.1 MAG: hypothetical protein A2339_05890 [Elusimicrobia bacterium RIFOXYB12_FULL_50_12]OGS28958.1 MAG: hypothetical protein